MAKVRFCRALLHFIRGAASRCLRCGLPLVLRRDIKSMQALAAKIHSFRPHSLRVLRSLGKCARRILEVRSPKSAVFGGGILHLPGCSVTLPALYCILLCKYCKEISQTNGKVTSRRVRGGAPRAPGVALYSNSAAGSRHSCIVVHFTCPLCERASSSHCGHI